MDLSKLQSQSIRTRVLFITGLVLAVLEVAKEVYMVHLFGHYSWSDFPFQLCSIPMYLCLLYPLFGKWKNALENFIMVFGFIGAIAAFSYPDSDCYIDPLLTVQSFTWHGILLLLSVFLMITRRKELAEQKYKATAILYLAVALLAVVCNCAFYRISGGTCNMFFFGPGDPSVTVLVAIQAKCGWVVETILMAAATDAGGFLFFKLIQFFTKKFSFNP